VAELTRLLKRVDAQFCSGSETDICDAHAALLANETKYKDNSEVMWRLAKSFRNLSTLEEKKGNEEKKKKYIFDGKIIFKFRYSSNCYGMDNLADISEPQILPK